LIVNPSRYIYPGVVLSEQLYEKIRKFLLEVFEFGVGCDSKLRCPVPDQEAGIRLGPRMGCASGRGGDG